MFYLSYLRSELVRRKSRTILTLLGLAIGVALVIIDLVAHARPRQRADRTALEPALEHRHRPDGHARSPQEADEHDRRRFGRPGRRRLLGGGGFGGGGREADCQANQSAITDLSKLGKPGTHFVQDFFLPGTQLTFPQSQAKQIAKLTGVSAVSTGLVLSAASTRRAPSRRSSPSSRPAGSG